MGKKKAENYLEYVPAINGKNTWDADEDKTVTIHMVHTGFYNKIAQRFFHRPCVSHIKLDQYGSFIWQLIDGERTVGEIANRFKAHFGEKAEPLYDRLVQYMKILRNNDFIYYAKKGA
ncbi:MAG: PqqD family protein [Clostridiales bacterium]|nr:PqqD family protein [Candidatus Cacconaster stercorequi]